MKKNYKYFQMNHQQVAGCFFHNAHAEILEFASPIVLSTSNVESKLHNSVPHFVNCHTLFDFGSRSFSLYQCTKFSLWVHHSRFSTLLSVLIQLIGFTNGLLSDFGMNVRATSLCILKFLFLPFIQKCVCKYQSFLLYGFKNLPVLGLHTCQSLVSAYQAQSGISRILTKLKNRYILKSGKNKMHLLFTQKCIQDFFDRNSIFNNKRLQYA